MLVSGSVELSPCNSLINISLKLYFKPTGVFHKAEENPVNKHSARFCFPLAHQSTKHSDSRFFSKHPEPGTRVGITFFNYLVKER